MRNILITGATGHLGRGVVNHLLKEKTEKHTISILARDPAKADELKNKGIRIIKGDYNDYGSLVSAFRGTDRLYFVSDSDVVNRLGRHQNVVNAAVEAGVAHIFYTSAQRKTEDGSSPVAIVSDAHWQTDNLIKQSGLTYTILKHGLYSDILPMFMGGKIIEAGTLFLPAGDGRSSYAARNDLAEAGAILLTTGGHENKIYEFGGSVSYSFHDIAEILTQLSGKKISYVAPSLEVFTEQMKKNNLPDEAIQGTASFCVAIAQGEFDFPSTDLEKILERKPQSMKEFLRLAYNL